MEKYKNQAGLAMIILIALWLLSGPIGGSTDARIIKKTFSIMVVYPYLLFVIPTSIWGLSHYQEQTKISKFGIIVFSLVTFFILAGYTLVWIYPELGNF